MERLVASLDRSAKLPTERSTERSDPFPHGLASTGSRAEPIAAGPNEGESNETSYRDATRPAVVPFAERQRRGAKRMRTSRRGKSDPRSATRCARRIGPQNVTSRPRIGSGERRSANGDPQLGQEFDRTIGRRGDVNRRTIEHGRDRKCGRSSRRIEPTDGTVVVERDGDQDRSCAVRRAGTLATSGVVMIVTRSERSGFVAARTERFIRPVNGDEVPMRARDRLVTDSVIMMPMPERTDGGGTAEDRQHQPAGCPKGQPFHRNERLEIEGRPTNDDSHCGIRGGQETGSPRRAGFRVRSLRASRCVANRSPCRQQFRQAQCAPCRRSNELRSANGRSVRRSATDPGRSDRRSATDRGRSIVRRDRSRRFASG